MKKKTQNKKQIPSIYHLCSECQHTNHFGTVHSAGGQVSGGQAKAGGQWEGQSWAGAGPGPGFGCFVLSVGRRLRPTAAWLWYVAGMQGNSSHSVLLLFTATLPQRRAEAPLSQSKHTHTHTQKRHAHTQTHTSFFTNT